MAISQPSATDSLNSPDHSLQHRIIAADPAASVESLIVNSVGSVGIGTTAPTAKLHIGGDNARQLSIDKSTVAVTAPGAGVGMLRWEAGTNAGTLKLVAYAGTSTIGTTVVDNVGAGN